jgi:regulator of protease activity HflC (stomatin/prohibitin superfamily)
MEYEERNAAANALLVKWIKRGVVGLIVLVLLFGSIGTISAGERGVKTRLGNVVGVVDPGLYFKLPFIEHVKTMDVRTLTVTYEREEPLMSASKDLQDVKIATVVNYHLDPTLVKDIYIQYRDQDNYEAQVVRPAVRDIVKATASQFTAEELVTKRAEFTDAVMVKLNERLLSKFSVVEQVNITNFEFSDSFSKAIEAKVTAEQEALASKNKLEQVKFEAQQTIEKSKADAEAIRIQAQAITQQGGKEYVNLKWVEKWNGQMPTTMLGEGATSLINLK